MEGGSLQRGGKGQRRTQLGVGVGVPGQLGTVGWWVVACRVVETPRAPRLGWGGGGRVSWGHSDPMGLPVGTGMNCPLAEGPRAVTGCAQQPW